MYSQPGDGKQGLVLISVEMNSILFQRLWVNKYFGNWTGIMLFLDMKCMHTLKNQYGTKHGGLEDNFPFQLGDFLNSMWIIRGVLDYLQVFSRVISRWINSECVSDSSVVLPWSSVGGGAKTTKRAWQQIWLTGMGFGFGDFRLTG